MGLVYNTVKNILIAPKMLQPEVSILVLGAWGCGAFGGDPSQISGLFVKALAKGKLGQLYSEVHFAIPKGTGENSNFDVFRQTFKNSGLKVKEVRPQPSPKYAAREAR